MRTFDNEITELSSVKGNVSNGSWLVYSVQGDYMVFFSDLAIIVIIS